jgi:ABC-2 type transport system permease protein
MASPVLSTSLYFIVFGAAIGSRMGEIDGVSYGAFIIPGLIMLSLLGESISNASFGIYMPEVDGHHLRTAVGAGVVVRGGARLRRRGGEQVGDARPLILATARLFVPTMKSRIPCGCSVSCC